eukprot:g746.t1
MVPRTISRQPQTATLRGRGEVAPPGGGSRPVVYDDVFRGSQTMPAMDERESLRSSRQADIGRSTASAAAAGAEVVQKHAQLFAEADEAGLGEGSASLSPDHATETAAFGKVDPSRAGVQAREAQVSRTAPASSASASSSAKPAMKLRSVETRRVKIEPGPAPRYVEDAKSSNAPSSATTSAPGTAPAHVKNNTASPSSAVPSSEPLIIRRARATKPLAERLGVGMGKGAGDGPGSDFVATAPSGTIGSSCATTRPPRSRSGSPMKQATEDVDAGGQQHAALHDVTSVFSERLEARGLRVRERFNQTQPLITSLKGEINAILQERNGLPLPTSASTSKGTTPTQTPLMRKKSPGVAAKKSGAASESASREQTPKAGTSTSTGGGRAASRGRTRSPLESSATTRASGGVATSGAAAAATASKVGAKRRTASADERGTRMKTPGAGKTPAGATEKNTKGAAFRAATGAGRGEENASEAPSSSAAEDGDGDGAARLAAAPASSAGENATVTTPDGANHPGKLTDDVAVEKCGGKAKVASPSKSDSDRAGGAPDAGAGGDPAEDASKNEANKPYNGWYSQKQAKANLAKWRKRQDELKKKEEEAAAAKKEQAAPSRKGPGPGAAHEVPRYSQKQAKANLSEWNKREQEKRAVEEEKERKKHEQLRKLQEIYKATAPSGKVGTGSGGAATDGGGAMASSSGGSGILDRRHRGVAHGGKEGEPPDPEEKQMAKAINKLHAAALEKVSADVAGTTPTTTTTAAAAAAFVPEERIIERSPDVSPDLDTTCGIGGALGKAPRVPPTGGAVVSIPQVQKQKEAATASSASEAGVSSSSAQAPQKKIIPAGTVKGAVAYHLPGSGGGDRAGTIGDALPRYVADIDDYFGALPRYADNFDALLEYYVAHGRSADTSSEDLHSMFFANLAAATVPLGTTGPGTAKDKGTTASTDKKDQAATSVASTVNRDRSPGVEVRIDPRFREQNRPQTRGRYAVDDDEDEQSSAEFGQSGRGITISAMGVSAEHGANVQPLQPGDGQRQQQQARPPSRGGESWQGLGMTTPPDYEQATPEQYAQYAQLHIKEYDLSIADVLQRRDGEEEEGGGGEGGAEMAENLPVPGAGVEDLVSLRAAASETRLEAPPRGVEAAEAIEQASDDGAVLVRDEQDSFFEDIASRPVAVVHPPQPVVAVEEDAADFASLRPDEPAGISTGTAQEEKMADDLVTRRAQAYERQSEVVTVVAAQQGMIKEHQETQEHLMHMTGPAAGPTIMHEFLHVAERTRQQHLHELTSEILAAQEQTEAHAVERERAELARRREVLDKEDEEKRAKFERERDDWEREKKKWADERRESLDRWQTETEQLKEQFAGTAQPARSSADGTMQLVSGATGATFSVLNKTNVRPGSGDVTAKTARSDVATVVLAESSSSSSAEEQRSAVAAGGLTTEGGQQQEVAPPGAGTRSDAAGVGKLTPGSSVGGPRTSFRNSSLHPLLTDDELVVESPIGQMCSPNETNNRLQLVMKHSKHKKMIKKIIPSMPATEFSSSLDAGLHHSKLVDGNQPATPDGGAIMGGQQYGHHSPFNQSAPSSSRSMLSNQTSSSNNLENDNFSRFISVLSAKLDEEEESRSRIEDELYDIQKSALDQRVKAKLQELRTVKRSPRWVERKMKSIRVQAEKLQTDIEKQRADSKALHAQRRLQFNDIEQQVTRFRRSTALKTAKVPAGVSAGGLRQSVSSSGEGADVGASLMDKQSKATFEDDIAEEIAEEIDIVAPEDTELELAPVTIAPPPQTEKDQADTDRSGAPVADEAHEDEPPAVSEDEISINEMDVSFDLGVNDNADVWVEVASPLKNIDEAAEADPGSAVAEAPASSSGADDILQGVGGFNVDPDQPALQSHDGVFAPERGGVAGCSGATSSASTSKQQPDSRDDNKQDHVASSGDPAQDDLAALLRDIGAGACSGDGAAAAAGFRPASRSARPLFRAG